MKITYPAAGIVSVWIGNFDSEDQFDACVDGPIVKALRLKTDITSICEVCFEEKPVPVKKLLEGFSGWESFSKRVEEVAQSRGLATANAALICYSLRCDEAPVLWNKFHFLGSFEGTDVS